MSAYTNQSRTFASLCLCTAVAFLSFSPPAARAQDSPFRWPEGKRVAVSLSFDDGRASQVDVGTPLFDRYGAKATFYVNPRSLPRRLDAWKKAAAAGHEIANHSTNHPCTGNFPWSRIAQCLPWIALAEARSLGRAALEGLWWRFDAHFRAWSHVIANFPALLLYLRERRLRGLSMGRFWPMIHRGLLFCPGIELPLYGWYPPCIVQGHQVRPMSAKAWIDSPGGQLRIFHANCYPHLGPTRVRVEAGEETLAFLSTRGSDTTRLEVPPARICFVAEHVFRAEETGALIDCGGWISVEQG